MGKICMPNMDGSIGEATIKKWLKKPGDAVTAGEPIAELIADKADVEVVAEEAGFLHIYFAAGSKLRVGQDIAFISADQDSSLPSPVKQECVGTKTQQPSVKPDLIAGDQKFWLIPGAILVGKNSANLLLPVAGVVLSSSGAWQRYSSHQYAWALLLAASAGLCCFRIYRSQDAKEVEKFIAITNGSIIFGASEIGKRDDLNFMLQPSHGEFAVVAQTAARPENLTYIWHTKKVKDAERLRELIVSMVNASGSDQWPPAPKQG